MEEIIQKIELLQTKIASVITLNKKLTEENEYLKMEADETKTRIEAIQNIATTKENEVVELKEKLTLETANIQLQKTHSDNLKSKVDACLAELNNIIQTEIN